MMQDIPDQPTRIVQRLLGSGDPELSCEECFDALDACVELELSDTMAAADASLPRMQAHLRGCSACRDDYDSLVALLTLDRRGSS
jgi:hypothetical protein